MVSDHQEAEIQSLAQ